ncbi:hypothetical protein [Methanobrevibacter sp.]
MSIRNGLEVRRKKLAELETMTLNNEINDKINHLRKEIRILESELDALL